MRSRFIDLLTGYEKSEEIFADSKIATAERRFTDALVGGSPYLASFLHKNPLSRFFSRITHGIVAASTRMYGILLLAFGVITLLLNITNNYFGYLPQNSTFDIAVGTVLMAISIPLLLVDIPFADLFQRWHTTSVLLFDVLCVKRYRSTEKPPRDSVAIPILIGAALAAIGFFFPMKYLLLGVLAFIYLALAFSSPEFSFMITVLLIPLYPIMPHSTVVLAALSGITTLSFISKVVLGKRVYHFEQYDLIILAFMAFVLISGIFNKGIESFESSVIMVCLCLAYFLTSNLIVNRRIAHNAVNIIIFASIPEAVYAFVRYLISEVRPEWIDPAFTDIAGVRAQGTFGNPNVYAVYLLAAIIFAAAFALSAISTGKRIYYIAVAILNTGALVLTWTRGAWVALIIAAVAALIVKGVRTSQLLLIPLLALPLVPFVLPAAIRERLFSIVNLEDTSIQSRLSIWRSSLSMLRDRLFIGVGVGEQAFREEFAKYAEDSVSAPHSHNLFLEIACEAGVFALLLIVILIVVRLRHRISYAKYVRISELGTISTASSVTLFALFTFGMTDYVWYSSSMQFLFWFVFGLGSAGLRISRKSYVDSLLSIDEELENLSAEANVRII